MVKNIIDNIFYNTNLYMKKNKELSYILIFFISIISIIFFIYVSDFYKLKEEFSINNELVSSIKVSFNNIFNPIKRTFRIHYNNLYNGIEHHIKKFNYHY